MNLKLLFALLILPSYSVLSQNKKNELIIETPENGKIENGIYYCNKFDWKITIPEGFKITDEKRIEELEKKGHEFIKKENPNGAEIISHPNKLVSFEIDNYNSFSSCFESLIGKRKLTLDEHKNFTEDLFKNTYSKIKGIKFELNKSNIKLGKYNFYKIEVRLYHEKTDKLLLTQELYNTYINDNLFSISINYTNENIGMLLNYAFTKSMQ